MDGLPAEAEAYFEPPLLLMPFRASELPPELRAAVSELVERNMRRIYDASGWGEESEAEPAADVGEALYLLLLEQPPPPPAVEAAAKEQQQQQQQQQQEEEEEGAELSEGGGEEDAMAAMVGALVQSLCGIAQVEFSVESGE
jgi:hypothetical protein